MRTPFSVAVDKDALIDNTASRVYPVLQQSKLKDACDEEYELSNLGSYIAIAEDDTDVFLLCDLQEEYPTSAIEYLDEDSEYGRRSFPDYGNQFYVPGYPSSALVAASTASLPIFAPMDPTTHSNPLPPLDESPPYAIYAIPVVLFSVMFITVVILSIRYRRMKRPQRLFIEPPRMDPEKMGTLRSTPLGIFMPEDDPFTSYSNDSLPPVEPPRPVPVFMPSEAGSSHSRRSTIRQSRSYTYTMPATRRSKRRPKVPKAQSASTIGTASSRRSSAERLRPPIPAARVSRMSASSKHSVADAAFHEKAKNREQGDKPLVAFLGDAEMEFGEDIPLNTPQQPGSVNSHAKSPTTQELHDHSQQEFWHKT
ncbi:hypothetical protein BJ165DRAFT_252419 [Panaeolus papilionaceus]|nr:hypothetical protein BJ165DRAFT_252419 [Panaeolus papilionaceus]